MDPLEIKINELEKMVDSISGELAESYFQVIKLLSRATEMTEKFYEGSHSRFVAEKTVQIASAMGMSDEDVMEARIAGQLHDIGKLNFPDTCLYKYPSEMSENEYSKYTQHPELGMQIIEPYKLLSNIGEIIFQHHERLDGSGFPKQLTRERIHPVAKIISVVDYFHNQIYKRQRAKGETITGSIQFTSTSSFIESTRERYSAAMNFLSRKSNVLFDPNIVDIFTNIIEGERRELGMKSVLRMPSNSLEPGFVFAEDYITSYGLLIAAKGEIITNESLKAIRRFIDSEELPQRLLIVK